MRKVEHALAAPLHPLNSLSDSLAGKRIALYTGAYNHIHDGVSLTLNRLVEHMEGIGARMLVFSPTSRRPPPIEHAGTLVSVPSIPLPGRSDYRFALGLSGRTRSRLSRFSPDLVHIATPDYTGLQTLRWALAHEVPVVSSYHTHFGAYLKYFDSYHRLYRLGSLEKAAWRYARWFYGNCAHVYVPTPALATELQSHGIHERVRMWSRGVDTNRFRPSHRSHEWRTMHGIGADEVVVSFVSRLVWEKGLSVFASVIEELHRRGIPHRSLVVGDGPARAETQSRLPDTVFTGPLIGHELTTAFASSDVFLFPSDTETFGNVTLEAMASGLPVVCANAAGSSSLVLDDRTGFLATPSSSNEFADHVARLIQDPALRTSVGLSARLHARTFSWDRAMERMAGYYREVLNLPREVTVRPLPVAATA